MKKNVKIVLAFLLIGMNSCESDLSFSTVEFSWNSLIEEILKFKETSFKFEDKGIYRIEFNGILESKYENLNTYKWNYLYYDKGVVFSLDCALKNRDTCFCFKKVLKNGIPNNNFIQSFYSKKNDEIIYRLKIKDQNPFLSGQFENIILVGMKSGIVGIYNIDKQFKEKDNWSHYIQDALGEIFLDELKNIKPN